MHHVRRDSQGAPPRPAADRREELAGDAKDIEDCQRP